MVLWDPVAAFTVVLGLATFGLWLSTRRLWKGAERADQPHLLISSIRLKGMDNDDAEARVEWEFKNHGKSPAWIESIAFGAYVGSGLPWRRPKYDGVAKPRHVVPPGSFFSGSPDDVNGNVIEIQAAQKYRVLGGLDELYVFGTMIYRDIARNRHETSFAYVLANDPIGHWSRVEPTGPDRYWRFT